MLQLFVCVYFFFFLHLPLELQQKMHTRVQVKRGGRVIENKARVTVFFKKMGQSRPLFVYFRSFLMTNIAHVL